MAKGSIKPLLRLVEKQRKSEMEQTLAVLEKSAESVVRSMCLLSGFAPASGRTVTCPDLLPFIEGSEGDGSSPGLWNVDPFRTGDFLRDYQTGKVFGKLLVLRAVFGQPLLPARVLGAVCRSGETGFLEDGFFAEIGAALLRPYNVVGNPGEGLG